MAYQRASKHNFIRKKRRKTNQNFHIVGCSSARTDCRIL